MVTRTAALALLAVTALVLAGSVPSPGAVPQEHRAAIEPGYRSPSDWAVTLDGPPERTAVGTVGLDVAQSLRVSHSNAQVELGEIELRHRLQAAETDEERFDILTAEIDSLEARLGGLHTAERDALAGYRAGRVSARDYLYRIAFITARVEQYMETASLIQVEGENIQAAAIPRSVDVLRTRASVIGGPLDRRVVSAYRGQVPPQTVRVVANQGGYVAVAVVDGELVRQSHRYDARASEDEPTNDLRTSLDHVYAQYPNETGQSPSISVGGHQATGVFYVTISTSTNVEVTSYVDNRNLTIFKEVYRQPLAQLPVDGGPGATEDGISLAVQRSAPTGLLQIRTSDADSGSPLDATVRMNETVVGRTGPDGELWTPERPGTVTITAVAGPDRSVSTTVSAGS